MNIIQTNIYNKEDLLELLKAYGERQKIVRIFGNADPALDFLDKCLVALNESEKELIEQTCLHGVSMRQYARETGYSRATITRERDKILNMLVKFFSMYDKPGNEKTE